MEGLMKTLRCIIFGVAILIANRLVSEQVAQLCYSYNPAITTFQATELKTEEKYQLPASVPNGFKASWDKYCPPCTLQASVCAQLPCQEHSIEEANMYNGIEVASDRWMDMANQEALISVKNGGGPFGTVIVQIDDESGKVIRYWKNHNHVPEWTDPTAHAEVSTIRAATKELGVLDLGRVHKTNAKLPQPSEWSHCVIYASAEPCPMCLSAMYWAGIKNLIFAATRYDAAAPGVNFSDAQIYEELARPLKDRKYMKVFHANAGNALDAFNYYKRNPVERYGGQSE